MSVRAEPPTLDWTLATDSISFNLLTNLMEGLTQYNADLEAVPAVAKRWEFSEEGKVITFYLRDDVFWTDGKRVTAGDFEYSWKRLLNPATAAQYAYFLFDIENAAEFNSGKITDPSQVGVRAISPLVLEVRLKKPVVYFPSITTFMVTFPQRQDIVNKYGDLWTEPEHIVTNGPFILAEWKHEYKLILKANDRHYEGRPAIDKVLVYVVKEPTTALTLFETGELDILELPPVAGTSLSSRFGAPPGVKSVAVDITAQVEGVTASVTNDSRLRLDADEGVTFVFGFDGQDARPDTSGVLAALGINTFFSGSDARSIAVNETLKAQPSLLASASVFLPGDGSMAGRIAQLSSLASNRLDATSIPAFYRLMAGASAVATAAARDNVDAASSILTSLQTQRESISGVNLDEEAIQLIKFQRAFQGTARFIGVVDDLLAELITLVR
ncbi:MAG: hypothetical protein IID17_04430 [Nitrospinae bacterium]|nr:hypothetical protein [Nitrospinota bacterium]